MVKAERTAAAIEYEIWWDATNSWWSMSFKTPRGLYERHAPPNTSYETAAGFLIEGLRRYTHEGREHAAIRSLNLE